MLGLALMIFFVSSFTTALQRVVPPRLATTARRPRRRALARRDLVAGDAGLLALLGALRGALDGALGIGLFAVVTLAATSALWWFTAWFLLLGDVRVRVLLPTGVITGSRSPGTRLGHDLDARSRDGQRSPIRRLRHRARIGHVVLRRRDLHLVGACAGVVFAEDTGPVGTLVRGGDAPTLTAGARPALPPPTRELRLRDTFQSTEDS